MVGFFLVNLNRGPFFVPFPAKAGHRYQMDPADLAKLQCKLPANGFGNGSMHRFLSCSSKKLAKAVGSAFKFHVVKFVVINSYSYHQKNENKISFELENSIRITFPSEQTQFCWAFEAHCFVNEKQKQTEKRT